MNRKFENYLVPAILILLVAGYTVLVFLSEGAIGGADNISHYHFSRFAFQFPEFFLYHWAKPLFTAFTAPFAQFGFNGVRIFNVLAGAATAYFTYRTARLLKFNHSVLLIFLLISSPLYTVIMLSGMTEILFSLMLILSIFLFFRKNYIWSALLLSFMPFVKNEGVVIIPLFLVAYAWQKQWKAIPFLLAGFVFYSIAGSFHYDDILWVIRQMPYTGSARDIYGSGDLLHYVNAADRIFGLALAYLVIAGLALWLVDPLLKKREGTKGWLMEMVVVYMPFLIFFAAHSYIWWKGMGNSVGEIRVMAAVIPSAALLGAFAWNRVMGWIPVPVIWKQAATAVLCIFLVTVPCRVYKIPLPVEVTPKLVKEASDWLKNSDCFENRIYAYDPFFCFFMDLNPWDKERVQPFVYNTNEPGEGIEEGEIVIWDAHFSPNEGRLPLENILDNPGFKLIHLVRPVETFKVLGGYEYEICIFQRITEDDGLDNREIYDSLLEEILKPEG